MGRDSFGANEWDCGMILSGEIRGLDPLIRLLLDMRERVTKSRNLTSEFLKKRSVGSPGPRQDQAGQGNGIRQKRENCTTNL